MRRIEAQNGPSDIRRGSRGESCPKNYYKPSTRTPLLRRPRSSSFPSNVTVRATRFSITCLPSNQSDGSWGLASILVGDLVENLEVKVVHGCIGRSTWCDYCICTTIPSTEIRPSSAAAPPNIVTLPDTSTAAVPLNIVVLLRIIQHP